MSCSNCYNGCAEIVSDKCVRYTGISVPVLGIQTGDSLSYIEQALIEFLTSTLDGIGILPIVKEEDLCTIVQTYLPDCGTITLNDYLTALVKASCDIQSQVTVIKNRVDVIESNYDVSCLSGVSAGSGTHAVLQATIAKLCLLGIDLTALEIDLDTNYVKLSDLDVLIQDYLDSQSTSTKYSSRMVPFTVVEYYGSLSNFDSTGAGTGDWLDIYLCNGNNSTPDKRGRVAVGAISGVPGPTTGVAVNPAYAGNPNYSLGDIGGANTIVIDATQIPSHTHTAVVTDTHYHYEFANTVNTTDFVVDSSNQVARALNLDPSSNLEYTMNSTPLPSTVGKTGGTQGTLSVSNSNTGDGLAHSNIQPVLACYYIMYIP